MRIRIDVSRAWVLFQFRALNFKQFEFPPRMKISVLPNIPHVIGLSPRWVSPIGVIIEVPGLTVSVVSKMVNGKKTAA